MKKKILGIFFVVMLMSISMVIANQFSIGTGTWDDETASNIQFSSNAGSYGAIHQSFLMDGVSGDIKGIMIEDTFISPVPFGGLMSESPLGGTLKVYLRDTYFGDNLTESNTIILNTIPYTDLGTYGQFFNYTINFNTSYYSAPNQNYVVVFEIDSTEVLLEFLGIYDSYSNGIGYGEYYEDMGTLVTLTNNFPFPDDDDYDIVMHVLYEPPECTPDWSAQYSPCNIFDEQTLTYNDTNSCGELGGLPLDNGTVSSCNYCTASYNSIANGCGGFTYTWNNYDSCCALTNITADCTIPINETCDACGTPIITSSGSGDNAKWVYANNCLQIEMRKKYNPEIEINTSLLNTVLVTGKKFKMILHGIEERQVGTSNVKQNPFSAKEFTSDISQGYVRYVSNDITLGYIIEGSTFKTVSTINSLYPYYYNSSILWSKTFFKKETGDLIEYPAPYVDGVIQPIVVEYKKELNPKGDGYNDFSYQKLGRGLLIQLDPIFTPVLTTYTPTHTTSDITGLVIDFGVEYGVQMIALAGLIVIIGLFVWAKAYLKI